MIKILDAEQTSLAEILARTEDQRDISGIVSRIIEDVRQSGDEALRRYTKEFDHAGIQSIRTVDGRGAVPPGI